MLTLEKFYCLLVVVRLILTMMSVLGGKISVGQESSEPLKFFHEVFNMTFTGICDTLLNRSTCQHSLRAVPYLE